MQNGATYHGHGCLLILYVSCRAGPRASNREAVRALMGSCRATAHLGRAVPVSGKKRRASNRPVWPAIVYRQSLPRTRWIFARSLPATLVAARRPVGMLAPRAA